MKGKRVLITGASSGIGRALALEAAKRGCHLGLMARNSEKLEAVAIECRNAGSTVVTVTGDVSTEADCRNFIQHATTSLGGIDVLINNAGMSMRALFAEADLSVIRQLMEVNFWGTVVCTKLALPELLKSRGSVVGISSIAGFKGLPARTGYSASKFAMNGFLESLRCENLQTGLHVLIAAPGYTASDIRKNALNSDGKPQSETPLSEEKLMTAEEVARHILNAIEKRRRYLILTTIGKITVWLNKFFPAVMDKMAFNYIRKEPDSPFK